MYRTETRKTRDDNEIPVAKRRAATPAWGRGGRPAVALSIAIAAVATIAACDDGARPCGSAVPATEYRPHAVEEAPLRLAETGLYADFAKGVVAEGVLSFSPQYPLWSDGARKRRWMRLPEATSIDATDPDAWDFPIGAKFWKEFAFSRRVETRYMERAADGGWIFATYLWNEDGTEATRAPGRGVKAAFVREGGTPFDVPSFGDCVACHGVGRNPVLGFGALQLSPDRDPNAPHAEARRADDVDLPTLAARGLLRGAPARLLSEPPRIAAATPRERAALGYLHGNCAGCHRSGGPLDALALRFDQRVGNGDVLGASDSAAALRASLGAVGVGSVFQFRDAHERVKGGAPEASVLWRRMATRDRCAQMPPIGTNVCDDTALALIAEWIRDDCSAPDKPLTPTAERRL